jgi:hypothetical protein
MRRALLAYLLVVERLIVVLTIRATAGVRVARVPIAGARVLGVRRVVGRHGYVRWVGMNAVGRRDGWWLRWNEG